MPSSPENGAAFAREGSRGRRLLIWNRRLHYYLGLYLLFFTWLFALTGLLLNHPGWHFAQFWPDRVQTTAERAFRAPAGGTDRERAHDVMRQLGISGEIQWPASPPPAATFAFQVTRPGRIVDVKADLQSGRAVLQQTDINAWGVAQVLHAFTGVPQASAQSERDWILTTIWAMAMDAVAAGLVLMVVSSYVMWFQLRTRRRSGIVALGAGVACCIALVAGLLP
jgi:hypothetical protein